MRDVESASPNVSRWYESIDRRQGRPPQIRPDGTCLTFTVAVIGGAMSDGVVFKPTPRTRLVIRCDRDGEITLRIAEGRTSGV